MWSETNDGHLVAGLGHRLQHVSEFRAQLGALVLERVVSLFQFMEVVLLLVPSGNVTGGLFLLIFVDVLLFAFLPRCAGSGFKLIGESIDVSAAVGEDSLDGQNLALKSVICFCSSSRRGLAVSEASL